jgi:hypothetical protein
MANRTGAPKTSMNGNRDQTIIILNLFEDQQTGHATSSRRGEVRREQMML